jgi:hypothetical protein
MYTLITFFDGLLTFPMLPPNISLIISWRSFLPARHHIIRLHILIIFLRVCSHFLRTPPKHFPTIIWRSSFLPARHHIIRLHTCYHPPRTSFNNKRQGETHLRSRYFPAKIPEPNTTASPNIKLFLRTGHTNP